MSDECDKDAVIRVLDQIMNEAGARRVVPDPAARNMATLARSFHVLRDALGIEPWDPFVLDDWGSHPMRGESTVHAVRFVLAVWDNHGNWRVGPFDLLDAVGKWDAENRAAFVDWARAPWRG